MVCPFHQPQKTKRTRKTIEPLHVDRGNPQVRKKRDPPPLVQRPPLPLFGNFRSKKNIFDLDVDGLDNIDIGAPAPPRRPPGTWCSARARSAAARPWLRIAGNERNPRICDTQRLRKDRLPIRGRFPKVSQRWLEKPLVINHNPGFGLQNPAPADRRGR